MFFEQLKTITIQSRTLKSYDLYFLDYSRTTYCLRGLFYLFCSFCLFTGKPLSEAFILTSTNPQYDISLFIDLPVQYMKTASSEHVVYINCSECQNKKQFVYTTGSEIVVFMY